jgi:hypothetical protein
MCAHGDLLLRNQNSGVRTGLFDPGQCECRRFGIAVRAKSTREVIMSTQELSETRIGSSGPAPMPARTSQANGNQQAASFMAGGRKLILEELQFASNEFWERTQTEMHLLSEFVSKVAGVHSVSDFGTMYAECSKHQIDFVRRDFDRVFKHGERMIEATSNLFKRPPD